MILADDIRKLYETIESTRKYLDKYEDSLKTILLLSKNDYVKFLDLIKKEEKNSKVLISTMKNRMGKIESGAKKLRKKIKNSK